MQLLKVALPTALLLSTVTISTLVGFRVWHSDDDEVVYSHFTVPSFACDLPDHISLLNTLCLSLKSVFSDENFIDIECECVTAPASNATSALASGRRQLSASTAQVNLQSKKCEETLPTGTLAKGLVSVYEDC
jgi:hypothetical protein